MSRRKTLLSTILLLAGTLVAGGFRLSPPVSAAGGGLPYQLPSHFSPSPYHLSARVEAEYSGRFALQRIDQHSRMTDGTLGVTLEPNGSLLGIMQLYGYDRHGFQTVWLAVLSNFQPLAHGAMTIELFDTVGQDLREALMVTRNAHGDLSGQLQMDGRTYDISWRKISATLR
jgi:hypothetical protein